MWALGVVLYTMLYGQFPFYDQVPTELFHKIRSVDYHIPDSDSVGEDTKIIIRRLLLPDPKQRLASATKVHLKNKVRTFVFLLLQTNSARGSSVRGKDYLVLEIDFPFGK